MQGLRIAVVGDIHVGFDDDSTRVARTVLSDVREVAPDVLLLTGDAVDLRETYWEEFVAALRTVEPLPYLISRGNADLVAGGDAAWEAHIGHPTRAVLDLRHTRLMTLGATSAHHELRVGEEPGAWIRARAGERPEADVIVLCHAPVRDTTFWSCRNTEDGCLAELLGEGNVPYHLYLRDSDEIAEALREAGNVRMFITGHVHHDGRLRCKHGYGATAVRDGVIHLATANVGGWVGFGSPRREYHVIELQDDTVRVRDRDFIAKTWVSGMEMRFPRWPAKTGS